MEAFRPPAPLQFSLGNVKEKWRKWRQELENYLLATEKDDQTDKIKIVILSTKNIHEMNIPENELLYIDSVNENGTKCAMKNSTDSNFKNVEMVSETTWYKNVSLDVNNKCFDVNFKRDTGAEVNMLPLYILNNAVPVIHLPRHVPLALQPKLKSILDRLVKEGIVSKVNKPTDWVQSLVIVEKPNGNLRLCLDPRDLNKVFKSEHYQIPCTDIISRLEGKKIFSVVDLKDGFWHVPLDEVSS
ncbi:transposon Tf2-6 polyprotein [Trichonephila clavipes]|nr:transposon Tf2-6 polyprotein [Trichonephila clavipes]